MPLVSEKEILSLAKGKDFAVPGFFAFNYEFIKIIIDVAEEERCPVVLCQGPEFIKKNGEVIFTQACKAAAMHATIPVSLAVDHSCVTDDHSIEKQIHNIHLGWNSVMIDGSLLPYDENVKISKELADICKGAGVSSCAALGEVRRFFPQAMNYSDPFKDDFVVPPEIMTDPKQAKNFVEETGVDTLAISIGQYVRSLWDGEKPPFMKSARLDFKRLEAIEHEVDIPLILHGATHVDEKDLQIAAKKGISMIKIASEQAIYWALELRNFLTNHSECMFPEDIQKTALEAVKESMRYYIRLFNADHRV